MIVATEADRSRRCELRLLACFALVEADGACCSSRSGRYSPEANCWPRFEPTAGTDEPTPDSAKEATASHGEDILVCTAKNPSNWQHCVESFQPTGTCFTQANSTYFRIPF